MNENMIHYIVDQERCDFYEPYQDDFHLCKWFINKDDNLESFCVNPKARKKAEEDCK